MSSNTNTNNPLSMLRISDAVSIDDGTLEGFVQYIDTNVVGIRLMGTSLGQGNSDGTFRGKRYFASEPNNALFVSMNNNNNNNTDEEEQEEQEQERNIIKRTNLSRMNQLKLKRELAASLHYTMKYYQEEAQSLKTGRKQQQDNNNNNNGKRVVNHPRRRRIIQEEDNNSKLLSTKDDSYDDDSTIATTATLRSLEKMKGQAAAKVKAMVRSNEYSKSNNNKDDRFQSLSWNNQEIPKEVRAGEGEEERGNNNSGEERERPEQRSEPTPTKKWSSNSHLFQEALAKKQERVDNLRKRRESNSTSSNSTSTGARDRSEDTVKRRQSKELTSPPPTTTTTTKKNSTNRLQKRRDSINSTEERERPEKMKRETKKNNNSRSSQETLKKKQERINDLRKKGVSNNVTEEREQAKEVKREHPNELTTATKENNDNRLFQEALQEKQKQIDNLQTALTDAELKNSELVAHAKSVEESNAIMKKMIDELESKRCDEIKKLEKSFEESTDHNLELQDRVNKLKEQKRVETEHLMVQKCVSTSKTSDEELQNRIEERKEKSMKMQKLKTYLLDCQAVQTQLLNQLIFYGQELEQEDPGSDQGLDKIVNFEKYMHVLNECRQSNVQNSSIQNQSAPLRDQVGRLETSLARAKAKGEQFKKRADSFEQENRKLEAHIAELKKTKLQHEEDQKEVADLRQFLSFSKCHNKELKSKISQVEEEKRTQVTKLEEALYKSQTDQNMLQEQAEKLAQHNNKLRDYVRNQQNSKRKLEDILQQIQKEHNL